MIIEFVNQKGGTGKTTNCIMFANYLVEKGMAVRILDLDFQQSAYRKRERDVTAFNNEIPYEIIAGGSLENGLDYIKHFQESKEEINLLVDLPGLIADKNIMNIITKADIVITPFTYESMVLQSTHETVNYMKIMNIKAKVFLVPNMLKRNVRYDLNVVREQLSGFGFITKELPERVALERIVTLGAQKEELTLVEPAYSQIVDIAEIK